MVILKTNNLTKKYFNKNAVDNVSMTIHEGDVYGFIGENGAGKTTFIRLIAGLIKKDGGDFTLFEDEKHNLGAVVETPSLYLYMTAMDNLMAQGKMLGNEDVEHHKELLRLVNLDYLIDDNKKAKDFSLGMRQRLGIAMSLLANPKFLVLDEPMNGLDPEGVVLMRNLIKSLSEQGITFLISSHMLEELSKVATRYGFIHKGKLIKEISLEELHKELEGYISLKVNEEDVFKVTKVFDENKIDYKVDNKAINIFHQSITDIVLLVTNNQVEVLDIKQENQGIETYYLSLIGGQYV